MPRPPGDPRLTPRAATTGVFFVNGAITGSWVAQIPWVQHRFGLSKSAIGLVILGMALGVVVTLPVAGQLIVRFGSRRMSRTSALGAVLVLPLVLAVPRLGLLTAGLFVFGAGKAAMDVAMNAHGVKIEGDLGRPIMSSLHAGWAFGGMTGAGMAAAGNGLGLDARLVTAACAVLYLAIVLVCVPHLSEGSPPAGRTSARFTRPSRTLLLLASLALLLLMCEGAMADWGGLLLRDDKGASSGLAALAYSCFAAGMTVGRVVGDAVNFRIGPVGLLRWGAALTAAALAGALLAGQAAVALAGLFLVGLGLANGIPLLFGAAGRLPDVPSGPGIAAVSSMGALGFVIGPPLLGFLADASSLTWALSTMIVGAVVVFASARRAATPRGPAVSLVELATE